MRVRSLAIVSLLAACLDPTEVTVDLSTDVDCARISGVAITTGWARRPASPRRAR